MLKVDQIIAGLGGRDINRLIYAVHNAKARTASTQPLIVGYFPGILHLRIFESLATRLCCDRVLLNCERDYQLYRQLTRATHSKDNGLLFGAPWIVQPPDSQKICDIDLLFVEQTIVPHTKTERTRLVEQIIALSHQHPEWRIVVSLRTREGCASSHQLDFCLEKIWYQLKDDRINLEFVVGDINNLLARARRVATVSSSVAYTSIVRPEQLLSG